MSELKHMTLGLDLGIASVGWCLFDSDENENPRRIIDLGSFVYNQLEDPKSGKRENQNRRIKRGIRRQRRRRVRRLSACRSLLQKELGVKIDVDKGSMIVNGVPVKNFATPFELKIKGLHEQLKPEELSIALYHYMKYRGFKSNRKSVDENDNKQGKVLKNIKMMSEAVKELGEGHYITEVIWNKYQQGLQTDKTFSIHNHGEDYRFIVARSEYEKEIDALLDKQTEFGVIPATFKNQFLELFKRQRSFSSGPADPSPYTVDFSKERGTCQFDGNPYAIKDSYYATAFLLLSHLNNFRYRDSSGIEQKIDSRKIKDVFEKLIGMKEVTYGKLLKACGIEDFWSIKNAMLTRKEKAKIISSLKAEHGIGKSKDEEDEIDWIEFSQHEKEEILKKRFFKNSELVYEYYKKHKNLLADEIGQKKLNYIAYVLFKYKTDDEVRKALMTPEAEGQGLKFSEEEIKEAMTLPSATKTIELSSDICEDLIPKMMDGLGYDEAMKSIGVNHYQPLQNKENKDELPEIDIALKQICVTLNNPVVKHTLVQMRKVINAIIQRYGKPTSYSVELARELKKNFAQRKEIQNNQTDNRNENILLMSEMMEKFPNIIHNFIDAKKKDNLLKYKLFKEQQGISPYTGDKIEERYLLDGNRYQIDHILPISRSFDDSFSNKVLVETKENQNKKNKTPMEYYGENGYFVEYAKKKCHDSKKRSNLLSKTISDDFIATDMVDSAYIATLATKLIDFYLLPEGKKSKTISGAITSKLRRLWNIAGRSHSYVTSLRKQYRLRNIENYVFRGLKYETKAIQFDFEYRDLDNLDNDDSVSIKIEKPSKIVGFDDEMLKTSLEKVLNNYACYEENFEKHIGQNIFELQDFANHYVEGSEEASAFDAEMTFVLAKVYGELLKLCDEKNRDNDLHHALDAAVIGCVTPGIVKRVSDFYKFEETELDYRTGEVKLEERLPYPDFDKEVLLRVYERDEQTLIDELNKLPMYAGDAKATKDNVHVMWPTRQQKTKVVGAISNETIFGLRKIDGKDMLVKKISVHDLNEKKLDKIVNIDGGNDAVIEACSQWLKLDAETRKNTYPILAKKNMPIKSVTIIQGELKGQPCLGENRYADNSDCIRVDVYGSKSEGDDRLYFVPIYYYQIFNEKRHKDVMYTACFKQGSDGSILLSGKQLQLGYKKIASMNRYTLIEIQLQDAKDGKPRVGYAYSGGASSGFFEIYSILGDNYDLVHDGLIQNVNKSQNLLTASTIKSIKVHNISVLGKIS